MTIKVNLDRVLLDRKMSLTQLADRVGITMANLSIFEDRQSARCTFFNAEFALQRIKLSTRRYSRL